MAVTTSELFNFLQGSDITGESSYDVWKSLNPEGTAAEFLESIRGKSAYEVWLQQEGNEGKTEEEFIESLKVVSSNYDLWLRLGYEGTPEDYLNSLKGDSAYEVWLEQEGNEGKTEEEFFASIGGGAGGGASTLEELTAKDTSGFLGTSNASVNAQTLTNNIMERIVALEELEAELEAL